MISVIIPTKNSEKNIGNCLAALLDQTAKNYEVIVVDNGSTDRTIEVAKKAGVRVLEQRRRGPAATRNFGAKKAKGSILLFTDSDCVPSRNWIEEMVKPFSHKNIAGVQGRYLTKQRELVARFAQLEIEERYKRIMERGIDGIGTYSAGYRKNVFTKLKGFDTKFPMASGEDFDFSYRVKQKYGLTFAPNAIVYHTHPATLLKYLKQKFWRAFWRVRLYKKHPEKMKSDSYTPQIIKVQIGLFYLLAASLILSPLYMDLLWVSLAALVLLIISSLPFAVFAARRDLVAGLASPVFIVLRSFALGSGFILGILRKLR